MSFTPLPIIKYSDDLFRELVNLYNHGTIKRCDLNRLYVIVVFRDPQEFLDLTNEIDEEYKEMYDKIDQNTTREIFELYKIKRTEEYIKMSKEDRFKRDFVSVFKRKFHEDFRNGLNNELEAHLDIIRWRLWYGAIDFNIPDNSDPYKSAMTDKEVAETEENHKWLQAIINNMKRYQCR